MVELVGTVVVDPSVPDGKAPGSFILLGTPEFKDGRLVAFHLDKYDYTFHADTLKGSPHMDIHSTSVPHRDAPPVDIEGAKDLELGEKARQARDQGGFY